MNHSLSHIGGGILVAGICALGAQTSAQEVTTTTAAQVQVAPVTGTITEFTPASETLVLKTESDPSPVRYFVSKQTTIVDESGAPVTIEKVNAGVPVSVQYTRDGDRMIVSRMIVKRAAPVVEEHSTTTTTTEKPLTHEEKEKIRHEEKRQEKDEKRQEKDEKELQEHVR